MLRQGAANGMLLQGGPPGPGSDWSEDQQQSPNQEAYDELVERYERVSQGMQQQIDAAEERTDALQRQLVNAGDQLKRQQEESAQQVTRWQEQFDGIQAQLADTGLKLQQQQVAAEEQRAATTAAAAAVEGHYELQVRELQQQWQQEKEQWARDRVQLAQKQEQLMAELADEQAARKVEVEQREQQVVQGEQERELLLLHISLKEGELSEEQQLRLSLQQQLEGLQQSLKEKASQLQQQQEAAAAAAEQAAEEQQKLEQQLEQERELQAQLAAGTAAELAQLREEQEQVLNEREKTAAEAFTQAEERYNASVKQLEGVVAAEKQKLEVQMQDSRAKEDQLKELLHQMQNMAAAAGGVEAVKQQLEADVQALQQQLAQQEGELVKAVQTIQCLQTEVQAKSVAAQEAREGLQEAAQAGEALRQLCTSLEAMVWGHAQVQSAAEQKLKKVQVCMGQWGRLGGWGRHSDIGVCGWLRVYMGEKGMDTVEVKESRHEQYAGW